MILEKLSIEFCLVIILIVLVIVIYKLAKKGREEKYRTIKGGKRFCLHDWKPKQTLFHFDSNVVETIDVCRKCSAVKRKVRPR